MRILVVTNRAEQLGDFINSLKVEADVVLADTGAGALESVKNAAPDLAMVDTGLADFEPLKLVSELLTVNAMVNTAVASPLSHDDFHEYSEGLGVLTQLPMQLGEAEASGLVEKLKGLGL